jgi:hypothetical protein
MLKMCSCFLAGLLVSCLPVWAAQEAQIINKTDKKLCLYAGYNVLSCSFMPGAVATVTVPTKVIYNKRMYEATIFRVTDLGVVKTETEKKRNVRSGISLCRKKDFASKVKPVWEVKSGLERNCKPGPQYFNDYPAWN